MSYTQLDGDFRCIGTSIVLYRGNPGSADECRARCDDNNSCKYYARWATGHCETYHACPSTAPDGSFKINRFEKFNDSPPHMTGTILSAAATNLELLQCQRFFFFFFAEHGANGKTRSLQYRGKFL